MANKLNPARKRTTVSFQKSFVMEIRKFAQPKKKSKTGTIYETTEEFITRMFFEWKQGRTETNPNLNPTYPARAKPIPSS